ncbi:GspE/PulE family protein [Burkholderia seminalis]|uniref:GspE/PulE family protein n=1 Tax=Burkholderia seminalis TaxID=488731 RepID=UPI001CF365D1|nr:GspE/PulE family protein [Burkholderia seminalis]MCA7955587.1 GspE/PulE family protein [Burkholderia seminalis]
MTARALETLSDALGQALLEAGLIDATQLEYAHQKNAVHHDALWRTMIESGLASEREIAKMLARLQDIAFVDIDDVPDAEPSLMEIFNRELCLNGNFLPIWRDEMNIVVLIGDALPETVSEIVTRRCGMRCRFLQSEFSAVKRRILHTYYFSQHPPEKLFAREVAKLAEDVRHDVSPDNLLKYLLHLAVKERSTDIHITPGVSSLHVLFRIDGVLRPIKALPRALTRLVGYIKLLSDMDISEARKPQDGSFRTTILDAEFTVRVSTIVAEHGERTVMRLLPEAHDLKGLRELGFFDEDVKKIAAKMASPAGLILITGPTGSGKSSTLHAGLRMQQLIERNVLTVEDPLEYRVPGAGQTEVNRRAGYDFSTALRHFLRHDPDVILLGEMRDAETAQAALDAAATGHLVLSTLHITSVFGVVPRLRPMGLVPQVIAENLLLVINQRLVRRVCPFCACDVAFTHAQRAWLKVEQTVTGKRGAGCAKCRNTGYLGRLPVYEILSVDDALANAIADDVGREEIRTVAFDAGFEAIAEVAKRRVILGQTTCDEVVRVIGEGAA